ncbi:MAG TPA: response regulator transcription factor [Flavisolibacter sp.]|nr:response regulator transcription factor [Flavisolibacter sp.]
MTSSKTRLVIADDHQVFLEGLKSVLKNTGEVNIIAEASDGKQLVDQVQAHNPQVVITDISMPLMNGVDAIKIIRRIRPATPIIGLSYFEDPSVIKEVIEAGASSFLSKNSSPSEILQTIKAVQTDDYYCTSTLSDYTIRLLEEVGKKTKKLPKLTRRETEITKLICRQLSSKEIAAQLCLSERTVEEHRKHILLKTGARNIAGVVFYAIKNKLVKLNDELLQQYQIYKNKFNTNDGTV